MLSHYFLLLSCILYVRCHVKVRWGKDGTLAGLLGGVNRGGLVM